MISCSCVCFDWVWICTLLVGFGFGDIRRHFLGWHFVALKEIDHGRIYYHFDIAVAVAAAAGDLVYGYYYCSLCGHGHDIHENQHHPFL